MQCGNWQVVVLRSLDDSAMESRFRIQKACITVSKIICDDDKEVRLAVGILCMWRHIN